jgi:adenylosuccinate synthase
MTINHVAVIGANFGDEGKGMMTDYFAATGKYETVIRFNGGSQAGHTVETPDGKRHVFSQIGSGTFAGLPTHISRFMLVNPIFFMREVAALEAHGITPKVSMDPDVCLIIPQDVMDNRWEEKARGGLKHGSVGHGVRKAIVRSYHRNRRLTVQDVTESSKSEIRKIFLFVLNKKEKDMSLEELMAVEAFCAATKDMMDFVHVRRDHFVMKSPCIFEGAQGLLLDQNSGFFPHVTPSNTGLANVMRLLGEAFPAVTENKMHRVDPVYVTRSYLTRHGAGPMYHDSFEHLSPFDADAYGIPKDETNVYNEWQEGLRLDRLSVAQLDHAVSADFHLASMSRWVRVAESRIALTWANVTPPTVEGESAYKELREPSNFVDKPFELTYVSDGKTRDSVKPQ